MGQVVQINGDYTIKARRPGGAKITFDTGPGGSVSVTGDLQVLGTTQTFNSQVISDVILVLNRGETGAGVTLRRSGLEIDRGSLDRADFLFDENVNAWTITHKLTDGTYSYVNSNLQLRNILTDANTDNGDLTLINTGTGVVKVAGTNAYETRVLDYTRLASVVITHIERNSSTNMITVTTATPHGLAVNDFVDIHCATFPAFNASNKIILDKTTTTFKYADAGATFANTPVSGYVIKNSLMWVDGSSYVPTDDYIPNMRAVSDYSRSLVNAAIENFSTSHIEDQNSNVLVYDSETSGGASYVKVTIDGIEKISVIGTGITTPATDFDLLNTNATTVNFVGAGTLINVGSGTPNTTTNLKNATINVGNGSTSSITTPSATFNLIDTNATTVNFAGAGTLINIGSGTTGTTTNLKNATINVGNGSSSAITTPSANFDLINTNATTVNFAGAGTTINVGSGTTGTTTSLKNSTIAIGNGSTSSITTPSSTFNLIDTNALTVNFAGAGTLINVGSGTAGTTTNLKNATVSIGNSNGDASITTPASTFNLVNTTATTVNFAGAATVVKIGNTTGVGVTTLHTDIVSIGTGTASRLTTPSTSFSLLDSVTDLSFGLSATTVNSGATTGQFNIRNPLLTIGTASAAKTTIATPSIACDLINTDTTTVNFAGAADDITIGDDSTGNTKIRNNTVTIGSGATSNLLTPSQTFNLLTTNATTVNFASAATTISMGSALPGITTINHDLVVTGSLTVNGPASSIGSSSLTVEDPIIYLGNNNPGDSFDLGFVGGYNFGPPGNQNPTHPHTGLVRDASDGGTWKLFSGVTDEPTTTVNFTNAVYDKLKIGDLAAVKGVFTGDVSGVKGIFSGDVSGVKGTFTGDVSGVKGIFSGDVSGVKGIFSGDITTTGNITGATITGTNFSGINISMVTDGCSLAQAAAIAAAAASGVAADVSSGSISAPSQNLTGPITSVGAATSINPANKTGTSNIFVVDDTPTLKTPILGVATATSINKVTITQPTDAATLTLAPNSKLITEGAFELTLKSTANTTVTFPEVTGGEFTVGYVDMPQVIQNSQGGPGLTDVGKHWFHTSSSAVTYYIDGNISFPIGSVLTFINDSGAGDVTITATGTGLVLAGTGFVTSLSVKLAADGIATAIKTTATKWLINGVGLTAV
jgi:hypothetical protein